MDRPRWIGFLAKGLIPLVEKMEISDLGLTLNLNSMKQKNITFIRSMSVVTEASSLVI